MNSQEITKLEKLVEQLETRPNLEAIANAMLQFIDTETIYVSKDDFDIPLQTSYQAVYKDNKFRWRNPAIYESPAEEFYYSKAAKAIMNFVRKFTPDVDPKDTNQALEKLKSFHAVYDDDDDEIKWSNVPSEATRLYFKDGKFYYELP